MDGVLKHLTESRDFDHRLRALENEVNMNHSLDLICTVLKAAPQISTMRGEELEVGRGVYVGTISLLRPLTCLNLCCLSCSSAERRNVWLLIKARLAVSPFITSLLLFFSFDLRSYDQGLLDVHHTRLSTKGDCGTLSH